MPQRKYSPNNSLRELHLFPGAHTSCDWVTILEGAEDEDVEWAWTHTPVGRYVCGYRLIPRVGVETAETGGQTLVAGLPLLE